jgi:drug/metabolite transporter (DMT)-like permease
LDDNLALGLAMGIIASVLLSVGKGVQKMKVDVLKQGKKMFQPPLRRDFVIWAVGVLMTMSASVFYSLALKFTDKSSIVSSLSGVGLVGLLIFARLVLKEKVGAREIYSSAMIIVGTGLIGYFNRALISGQKYDVTRFTYVTLGLFAAFAVLAVLGFKYKKIYGFSFGVIAGSLIGIAMILADMALVKSQGDMLGQFNTPFVYLAILCSAGALALTQVAFFKATAVVVVPTINSFTILAPLLVEFFTFGVVLAFLQYLGVAMVLAGVIILTTSPKQAFGS